MKIDPFSSDVTDFSVTFLAAISMEIPVKAPTPPYPSGKVVVNPYPQSIITLSEGIKELGKARIDNIGAESRIIAGLPL